MYRMRAHAADDAAIERRYARPGAGFEDAGARIPGIVRCRNAPGRYDAPLHVIARGLDSFGESARSTIRTLPGTKKMNASLCLKAAKQPLASPAT